MATLSAEDRELVQAAFDSALNGDIGELEVMIAEGGVHPIFLLADSLQYPRKDEIYVLAVECSMKQHAQDVQDQEIEYVYGCRHPASQAGKWDRAFVVAKDARTSRITSAMFESGTDFIGHPKTDEEALEQYALQIANGWIPMTNNDLANTSGIALDKILDACG